MKRPTNAVEEGLERQLRERSQELHTIARRAGQDHEDVVQEAFLKAVEISRREEIQKVDNLVFRIVRCVAISWNRRREVRMAHSEREVETSAEEDTLDVAADPERTVMGAQRLKRVMAVINAMPPRRREVFLLHRIEEMTYPQIARRIGVSAKAVEKHVHLAMRQLSDADD